MRIGHIQQTRPVDAKVRKIDRITKTLFGWV